MPRPLGSATIAGPQKPLLQSRKSRRAGSAGSRHVSPVPTTSTRRPLQAAASCGGGGVVSFRADAPACPPGSARRRRLAAEAELALDFVRFTEARLLDLQRFAWIAVDLREGRARVAVRGPDRIGAVESHRHIATADASSAGSDEVFGAFRFADAAGGSDLRNVAAGENGHSASVETSGHGAPGTIHERLVEMPGPLLRREIGNIPPDLHPSPVDGNDTRGQAAQPQTNGPFPCTGHSRSPTLWMGTSVRMVGCQPLRSTSQG